jgi:hypothetical protein
MILQGKNLNQKQVNGTDPKNFQSKSTNKLLSLDFQAYMLVKKTVDVALEDSKHL